MRDDSRLKVLFYGDDFTGSSENLAQFHRNGVRGKLYLKLPEVGRLARDAAEFDVLGIAGTSRALSGEDLVAELDGAFSVMSQVPCNFLQYKLCSTFDSSPTVGSFGVALDRALVHFGRRNVPVVAASPDFGRYTCFGNHFARFGGRVERLDRHPSMSAHPRTPMHEADLCRHLAAQTSYPFQNIFLTELRHPEGFGAALRRHFGAGSGVVFDGAENADLLRIAEELWVLSRREPCFALAAQGLAQHLGAYWAKSGQVRETRRVATDIPPVDRLLVLSGSCALQTGRQIAAAEQAGWNLLHLDPRRLATQSEAAEAVRDVIEQAIKALSAQKPVVVYTARGQDGRVMEGDAPADRLGAAYAEVARAVRGSVALPRIVFSGGDSSSYAVRHLGADALEIAVFDGVQNSHVCRLSAYDDPAVNGLEVMLKGGQVGEEDFFLRALAGTVNYSVA